MNKGSFTHAKTQIFVATSLLVVSTAASSAPNFRSIDGSGNNPNHPDWGAANTQLTRVYPNQYGDGIETMGGAGRPSPRVISNTFGDLEDSHPSRGPSDFVWQWGQFLDHDISISEGGHESAPIAVPEGDPWFDPTGTGTQTISFHRTHFDPNSSPREQINDITGWIDASNVYGSDPVRASALRTNDGTGKLKTSAGGLLPFNETGLPNAGGTSNQLFLAGDIRANEQVGLISMHTLFVREHNRLVDVFAAEKPDLSADRLYEKARKIVGAQMQHITYKEYLPALLGNRALAPYRGYKKSVDARLNNSFTTALYRYGHSLISPELKRLDTHGAESPHGHLPLQQAFFAPHRITTEGGIDPILRGLASQACRNLDLVIVSDLRNFLFGQPGSGGFDLMSLNIQRGRDHGLPSYNQARIAFGLAPVTKWRQISSKRKIRTRLKELYSSVDDIDLWVGALAEDTHSGMVGKLVYRGLVDQFERLRDGDRFWYQKHLNHREMQELAKLSKIIRRNTDIGSEIHKDVFHVQ